MFHSAIADKYLVKDLAFDHFGKLEISATVALSRDSSMPR
jgi:hypothetical protein